MCGGQDQSFGTTLGKEERRGETSKRYGGKNGQPFFFRSHMQTAAAPLLKPSSSSSSKLFTNGLVFNLLSQTLYNSLHYRQKKKKKRNDNYSSTPPTQRSSSMGPMAKRPRHVDRSLFSPPASRQNSRASARRSTRRSHGFFRTSPGSLLP